VGGTRGFVAIEELVVHRQARRVVGDAPHRGLVHVAQAGAELAGTEIVVGGLVEVDLPLFLEQHQAGGGDGLGDRCQRVHGVLGRGAAPLAVGPAKALFPDDLAVAGHGHRDRRNVLPHEGLANLVANLLELVGARRRPHRDQSGPKYEAKNNPAGYRHVCLLGGDRAGATAPLGRRSRGLAASLTSRRGDCELPSLKLR